MIPSQFNEDGSVDEKRSLIVKAETGPSALFLLRLYRHDPQPRYLAAAEKALGFIDSEVTPLRQWYDFETFWSCVYVWSCREGDGNPKTTDHVPGNGSPTTSRWGQPSRLIWKCIL